MLLIVYWMVFPLSAVVSVPKCFGTDQAGAAPVFDVFAGQDLYLQGPELERFLPDVNEYILVFPRKGSQGQNALSLSVGSYQFSADRAITWIEIIATKGPGGPRTIYEAKCYLEGNISVDPPFAINVSDPYSHLILTGIEGMRYEDAIVLQFRVSGEVFITADRREMVDPRGSELYSRAFAAMWAAGMEPTSSETKPTPFEATEKEDELQPSEPPVDRTEPSPTEARTEPNEPVVPKPPVVETEPEEPNEVTTEAEEKEPEFRYLINLSPIGETPPNIKWEDQIGTVIGRFYLSQKQDEKGGLLEMQADNAVLFASGQQPPGKKGKGGVEGFLIRDDVRSIYLAGDVVLTNGQRTIRADEIYYEFQTRRGIATNVVMRTFSATKGIPIYVRAEKLKLLAENELAFDDATVTTSEFYLPQISFNVSKATITDTTPTDERQGGVTKSSFDARLHDVELKADDRTVFYWPYIRANLERPDLPIKSVHAGYDNTWGASLETRWYLARLLGLQEPEGTESTLALDYFSKRGFGAGVETEYQGENYLGRILGYIIHDTGEDRLGRHFTRKDLEPPRELRGRFRWQHRHFLPYEWQLTTEISYLSDENFLESFYRSEFNVGKEQETLVHLKRIEDNWGLAFLGKARINDFVNQLEELPTAEFHWTGQSLLNDTLTFYSDSQASRLRQRYASTGTIDGPEQFFSFATTRNEVDMPLDLGKARIVPFVAGTVAYEDGLGFYRELDGGMAERDYDVWSAETGVRVSTQPYWRVFPNVQSQLWDLNQLRHVIRPSLTAVGYTESDAVFEQRDTLHAGISQRLQTRRGIGDNQRTVDWMRLDVDVTWVNNSDDATAGADRFIWNKPLIPSINTFSSAIPLQDRRSSQIFGPRRNYVGADYIWRLSDTTAVLSDMNYDMQSGVVQQFNVGLSHLRWPNLQYYVGSRYLRRLDNGFGEHGSNAFTFAVTYVLDPRYTVVFSQQVDFDYGKTVRSDITLIRRYHRLYWGLTFSADESLDRQAVTISLWPQGVSELAIGEGKYGGLGGSAGY